MHPALVPMPIATTRDLGVLKENIACRYLRENGFVTLGRNIRFYGVEIDFLCKSTKEPGIYFFVEVKSVKRRNYARGYQPFSYRQWSRYEKAVIRWQEALGKFVHVHTSLLLLDESGELLEFIPDFRYKHTRH